MLVIYMFTRKIKTVYCKVRWNCYKLRQLSLLQSAVCSYYKVRQLFLLQKASGFITNCARYCKLRWIYYKLRQVVQSAMIIINGPFYSCACAYSSDLAFEWK